MKAAFLSIIVLFCLQSIGNSQPPPNESKEKMKSLQFLVGNWEGEGWISFGPNQKHEFNQTEEVQYKLGDTILMIEGRGIDKNSAEDSPRIVHNAFAIINYDSQSQQYMIRAYKSNGQFVVANTEVGENNLVWEFEIPQGKARYTININESNQWHEIGEFSRDGENWFKNFEMTLSRKE
jgi:hypothetical protein